MNDRGRCIQTDSAIGVTYPHDMSLIYTIRLFTMKYLMIMMVLCIMWNLLPTDIVF